MMPLLQAAVSNPQDVYNLSEHIGVLIGAILLLGALTWWLLRALLSSHRRIMASQLEILRGEQEAHQELAASKLDAIGTEIAGLASSVRAQAEQDAQEHREFRASFMAHGERIGRLEGAVFRPFARRHDDPPEGLPG